MHSTAERRARWGTDDLPDGLHSLQRWDRGHRRPRRRYAQRPRRALRCEVASRSMGRRTTYTPGTPCWVDLTTTDPDGRQALLRRGVRLDGPRGPAINYTFFEHEGATVAGLQALMDEQREQGMPPSWSMYVHTDDADATRRPRRRARRDGDERAVRHPRCGADGRGGRPAGWRRPALGAGRVRRRRAGQRGRGMGLGRSADDRSGRGRAVLRGALRLGDGRGAGQRRGLPLDRPRGPEHRRDHARAARDRPALLDRLLRRRRRGRHAGARRGRGRPQARRADGRALGRFAVALDPQGAVFCLVDGEFDD